MMSRGFKKIFYDAAVSNFTAFALLALCSLLFFFCSEATGRGDVVVVDIRYKVYMPSCERIPLHQFHSVESRRHTGDCVRDLTHSKEFRRYVSHVEYSESLQATWFIAPIGLTIALYYHLLLVLRDTQTAPVGRPEANFIPSLPVTAMLLFFIAPCVVIAPFTGFFEPLSRRGALRLVALLTFINLIVVSFGGRWLHHPPFLLTAPPIPWFTGRPSEVRQLLTATLTRALPLQGGIVAGWLVYVWRRVQWRNAWHVPLPLVTIPILVGVFGCLWFCLTSRLVPFVTRSSFSFPLEGLVKAVNGDAVGSILSMVSILQQELLSIFTWRSLAGPSSEHWLMHQAWCAALSLSISYALGLLLSSVCCVFGGVFWLLPTHPTTWGLCFISCLVGVYALLQNDGSKMGHVLGLLALACMLLRNGFVLTY
ncbi:hypothetical protein TraAM80_02882 [Trypanosoma rangeli]|uniref:Uncharacterized protein n=1 Tax=Trypanosoma rangeli TaxID=5698 RepID=A0A3R7MU19_TRYRA|nr:uncharacterized protein TraAM80_02882 [Trypanosoma rangeli]RNF08125.1 hypothetical protein TraAM80_02882 [Trypanosoma rangeli]|eukprot:RNF08125.1 hypothetical protein TraAM80_02882 [Trypanosoma rangeli]